MKFDYLVKHNGIYYPAGTDVPIETNDGGGKAPVDVSGKVEDPVEKPVKDEKPAKRKFTDEDLDIPYMKLKSLAKNEGIKVSNTMKADEIKELLRAL